MSSNLLKWGYTNVQQKEVRVIDANVLMEKRMEGLGGQPRMEEAQYDEDGFVSGLAAAELDSGAMTTDGEESGNVIKALKEDPEELLSKAGEEANMIREKAQKEASQMLDEARRQAERERATVMEEARRQGYEEGTAQAAKEAAALQKKFQDREKQLEDEYQRQIDELEPQFIDVITGVYEEIFHVELESYREILTYLIASTIRSSENSHEFMVHVSKEDYPFVSMQKKQLAAAGANSIVEIIEDQTLSKNQCLIETESGIFDCGVDTQLEELTRRLKLLSYGK